MNAVESEEPTFTLDLVGTDDVGEPILYRFEVTRRGACTWALEGWYVSASTPEEFGNCDEVRGPFHDSMRALLEVGMMFNEGEAISRDRQRQLASEEKGEAPMNTYTPAAPKYPGIHVQLTGSDGNAFALLGLVNRALKSNGVPKDDRDAFIKEAMSGDDLHLVGTCQRWVDCH